MIHYFMCLLVLGTSLIYVVEGCGRVPATPAPPTSPAPTEPTINGSARSYECTSEEKNRTACLNGGTCFVLVIGKDRVASCHCTEEYMGERCDHLNIIYFTSRDGQLAKAGIVASVVVLVLIIMVFTAVAIVYFRQKRQERRERHMNEQKKRLNLPENHVQPKPDMKYTGYNGNSNYISNYIEEKRPLQDFPYRTTPV